jgi:hypothetical protein
MADKVNLIKKILTSDRFRNSTAEQQQEIMKQILETKEVSQEELEQLYNDTYKHQLEKLPYNLFTNIVLSGDIKGEDLLSLCNSSAVLREYCNRPVILETGQKISQYLFRQLIEKERPGYPVGDQEEPRTVYEKLTTKRFEDFSPLVQFIERLHDEEFLSDDEYLASPKNLQMLLYASGSDQWGLLFRELFNINPANNNYTTILESGKTNALKEFLDTSYQLVEDNLHYIVNPETIPTVNPTVNPIVLQDNNINGVQLVAVHHFAMPAVLQAGPFQAGALPAGPLPAIGPLLQPYNPLLQAGNRFTANPNREEYQTVLNQIGFLWDKNHSFPEILNALMNSLNIDLATIVQRIRSAITMTSNPQFIPPIFKAFQNNNDIVNMWQNYEKFYILIVNMLLPKDSKSLENLVLNGLISIVDHDLDLYSNAIQDQIDDGQEANLPLDAKSSLAELSQISKDLHNGVYGRIVKWLVKLHRDVQSGKYSIFTPIKFEET